MDIAIIGLGCRFPGAPNPLAFWELVRQGGVTFRPIPTSRWNHSLFFDTTPRSSDKTYVERGAYLEDEELRQFAALHFGMAPRRVQVADPQHRLLLETVRGAVQDAGYECRPLPKERTGVFVGASVSEYKELHLSRLRAVQLLDGAFGRRLTAGAANGMEAALVEDVASLRAFSIPGNLLNMAAATVAQVYDLSGPAFSIDAACSSALVAVHNAVVQLRAREIDLALAGGVYLNLLPDNLVGFSRIGAISRIGACKPFDAEADGFLMGEGVGVVMLKRREDAEQDGDRIYALIKGAGCNNDGRSEGPMTPRQGGQLAVLQLAYRDAQIAPQTLGYIEAHGTATTVGDVVEVAALRELFNQFGWTPRDGAATALGSVKANIGHTMSAAGVAGLLKAVLALHYRTLPPQPSIANENPRLGLVPPGVSGGPFYLPRSARNWERTSDHPRRAGVSSFGFGGTNAHVVLEEPPERARAVKRHTGVAPDRPPSIKARAELLVLSAVQPSLVAKQARELLAALPAIQREGAELADLAYTLSTARAQQDTRLAVVAESFSQLEERLGSALKGLEAASNPSRDPIALAPGVLFGQGPVAPEARRLAFLFPGQGAQRVGMLREAYEQVPAFKKRLDALDDALGLDLHHALGGTLRSFLYPLLPLGDGGAPEPASLLDAERRLTATEVCQPAMAAVELALCALLGEMGIEPSVTVGHSLGEFVAASVAGVLTPEECVRWVTERGLAMVSLPLSDSGAMASAAASREEVGAALAALGTDYRPDGPEPVVVANLNHPQQTVISGSTRAVAAASASLSSRGIKVTRLGVSHAFHSPLMAGLRSSLSVLLEQQPIRPPRLPVVSAISAERYPSGDQAPEAIRQLWLQHATAPLEFVSALRRVAADEPEGCGSRLLLQVGGGSTLLGFARGALLETGQRQMAALTGRVEDGLASLANALGMLWVLGTPMDFQPLFDSRNAKLLTLPPTPLETQPYWVIERTESHRQPILDERFSPAPIISVPSAERGDAMDPLVSLFREQVALLQAQTKMLEKRGVLREGAAEASFIQPQATNLPGQEGVAAGQSASAVPQPTVSLRTERTGTDQRQIVSRLPVALAREEIGRKVLNSVARISAFPLAAVKPTQTLAGDLGFDSLMTVELDADLSAAFPAAGGLPRDLIGAQTTVNDLIDHLARALSGASPSPSGAGFAAAQPPARQEPSADLSCFVASAVESPLPSNGSEPLPKAVLITRDGLGVAEALARRLGALATRSTIVDLTAEGEAGLRRTLESSQAAGQVGGIIHLSALTVRPDVQTGSDIALELQSLLEPLIWAHRLARLQTDPSLANGGLFVTATAQGGLLGVSKAVVPDVVASIQGASVAGFVKALARERPDEHVQVVDLRPEDGPESMADALIAELRSDDATSETGWCAGVRRTLELIPMSPDEAIALGPKDVVLVTGGGRGVGAHLASALARRGCSLILVGRSPQTPAVDSTLKAIRDLGARALYAQWDVTQPVGAALDRPRAELGRVTAIVHAAGVAEDAPVGSKDEASFQRVIQPKLKGLLEALAATLQDPVRAAVLVSSWSGRFGNASQTDYSAANAAMSRLAALLPTLRPGLRAVALAYPPWEGTEMVGRIPRLAKEVLRERGVPFIDDAVGEAALLTALDAGAQGDVLLAPALPARSIQRRKFLLLDRRNHLYLDDHQLGGHPVLPFAAALDLMAHAAFDSGFAGSALRVRGLELREPVRIDQSVLITFSIRAPEGVGVDMAVTLSSTAAEAPRPFSRRPAYLGRFALEPNPSVPQAPTDPLRGEQQEPPMTLEEFYRSTTFHGPRMHGIASIEKLTTDGIIGWVQTSRPADWIRDPGRTNWLVDPLAIDGAFQLAAYWAWVNLGRAGFPTGIEEYRQFAPLAGGPVRVCLSLEQSSGEQVRGTLSVQDHDGKILATARGVQGEFKHRDPRFLRGRAASASPAADLVVPEVETNPPAAPIDPAVHRIDQFPEVQELQERLAMVEAFGLKNPYFNVHEQVTNHSSVVDGRTMVNWSSYNYLGLSGDAQVSRAAQEAIARYGTSVSASRVASGEKPLHRELERQLAAFLGTEDALVMVSGHAAFVTVIGHMIGPNDLVVHDALAHDCIMGGAKLSGAKRRPFPHNDWEALDRALSQLRSHYRRVLIAIEGVYSMDGDIPDLPRFIEVKKKHRALLLVDEAHSIGVLGDTGRGIGEHFAVERPDVDFWMGTLSKSLASCGGYVGGSRALVQYLKYTAPGFVYSVGISPANAAAASEALRQIQDHPERVRQLHERAQLFLRLAKERGVETGFSGGSAVVPAILGNSMHSLQISEALRQRGINVQPILYPAVEESLARLRFFVTATHSEQQIRETILALQEEIQKVLASPSGRGVG